MNSIKTVFACLVAIFFAAPAVAKTITADGVVIFNQADVDTGGITPGDTPGFPASLLVSGSYRLGSGLTVTTLKNAIVVGAPAVTLDLNGFKVAGSNAGRTGVYSDQIDTTVKNGIIRSFTLYGIQATVDYLKVDNVTVTNNGDSGIATYPTGDYARITGSTIVANGWYGIVCAAGCLVQSSVIAQNVNAGIYFSDGGNAVDNVIRSNAAGIAGFSSGYGNNTITGNSTSISGSTITANHPNACDPACPAPAP